MKFWREALQQAKYVVAPMVDQSELAWRLLCRRYGAQLCYTPMLHSAVFIRDATYRRENFKTCPEDRPLIVQFCGNDPDTLLKAAKIVEPHCDAVDLNLGCPQAIAKRGHYGAFLQDDWKLLEKIVSHLHQNLKIPVTCKIRIFNDLDKTVKYAQLLEKAGCQLLTVHGRTREQKKELTGLADWNFIKVIKDSLSIPVFANGNIQYFEDLERCFTATGVDGIMSAEGILTNPALFSGKQVSCWQVAEEYLQIVHQFPCTLSSVRGHLFKIWIHGTQRHLDLRNKLATGKSLEALVAVNTEFKQRTIVRTAEEQTAVANQGKLPYWICQPYIRPSHSSKKSSERQERDEEVIRKNIEASRKARIKRKGNKIKSNGCKRERTEFKYKPCANCSSNPSGTRCEYGMCRKCCKSKTYNEVVDCKGIVIFYYS
ncbi:uncharacterized protein TRIADDRAFT_21776 [Trichoplax adhaerens]|uniref:tRNA-dihydrouridine(16/17) synthase [NAD(P)(+)]-like n=1 Tax=Trichoplax adhaerens TaxID=10228 RepID=B3RPY1_TRIAD|nr:hypothetical protein TRIADDRAFT_21776 [Trichoplax adhaerens]EDV28261.1 hypothetical protein TRIADDRAFT_21776 [Trichoplax adhaerens]|eukprot:XP_002110095.1 hypothetical protein TRIADDRAFT_21776 [Trichoplax adhaerens]